jgi:hypothetical protein
MAGMDASESLRDRAGELVEAARAFHAAAERPRAYMAAPDALESLEEALQVLSGAWHQLAAAAAPGAGPLHDVAAALARCAHACRERRATATARDAAAADRHRDNAFPRFERYDRPRERVA